MDNIGYIIGIVIGVLLVGGTIFSFFFTMSIAKKVYAFLLVRDSKDKWGRVCSAPENEEQMEMWNAGCAWAESVKDKCHEVHIVNEGLNLYGEFYDFGSDRCVIISPGRCECLKYSYYYAMSYEKINCNVLVVDARAHGNSDGMYSTIGLGESRDLKAWIEFIQKEFGVKEVFLHGICVGSSSSIFLATSEGCPACVKGIITDGCFVSFREVFKTHMQDQKRPLFPVLDEIMWLIKKNTGTNVYKWKPIKYVPKLKTRIMFIYGEKDIFALPKKSQKLYDLCGSEDKQLVWMPKGGHSHLRLNNTEAYDKAIADFLRES